MNKTFAKILILLAAISLLAGCVRRDNPTLPTEPPQGQISRGAHQYTGLSTGHAAWNVFQSRQVAAYWPAGYDPSTVGPRFPVLYLLPGFDGEPSFYYLFGNENYYSTSAIAAIADELIAAGEIKPLLIVMPDASIYYGGSFYNNNALAGEWESMMAVELVDYVDNVSGFRSLVDKDSRAISGHSSGGYGAIRIAMAYPNVFNSVSAIDAPLAFEHGNMPQLFQAYLDESGIDTQAEFDDTDTTGFRVQGKKYMMMMYSMAATFSPVMTPGATKFSKLQIQLPFDYQGQTVTSVWNAWLSNDLYSWLDNQAYRTNLAGHHLYLEHSSQDAYFFNLQTQAFIDKLHDVGVNHTEATFGKYDGGSEFSRAYLYDRLAGILKFHDQYLKDRNGNF